MASASAPTLRRGLHVVGQGIRQQPRWFALAVLGSTVYGVMTVGLAWAIGKVTDEVVAPAVAARQVEAGQLWWAGLVLTAVVLLNVIGIVVRRVAAGITFNNLGATYRRRVTRQYLRLPLSWHHRHPSGQLLSNANADVEATWQRVQPAADGARGRHHARRRRRPDGPRRPGPRGHRPDRLPPAVPGQPGLPAPDVAARDPRPAAARRRLRGRPRELRGGADRQVDGPRGRGGRPLRRGDRPAPATPTSRSAARRARSTRRSRRSRPSAPWRSSPSAPTASPPARSPRPRWCRWPTSSRSCPSRSAPSAGCSPSCPGRSSGGTVVDAVLQARGGCSTATGRPSGPAPATPRCRTSPTPTTSAARTAS